MQCASKQKVRRILKTVFSATIAIQLECWRQEEDSEHCKEKNNINCDRLVKKTTLTNFSRDQVFVATGFYDGARLDNFAECILIKNPVL